MSNTRTLRRRNKQANYHTIDNIAERENGSIKSMIMIGPVQQSRLNFTYRVDGFVFNTGKRHRGGGVGVNMKAGGDK